MNHSVNRRRQALYQTHHYYLNISVEAVNLSDCRIESNRMESKLFCPNWNALTATVAARSVNAYIIVLNSLLVGLLLASCLMGLLQYCDSSTIRVGLRFERDSSMIRARHATTRYEVFRALAYEIDSSTLRESVVGVSCMLIDSSMHTAFTLYL